MNERPFLSIIIPAFNEALRIIPTLKQVERFLAAQPWSTEVVVVDDGSLDETVRVTAEFAARHPRVRVLTCPHRGKGGAVRAGMLAARGDYRFLCDADLSMPIEALAKFLPPALHSFDVAIGSREAPGAHRYGEPFYRHLMGRVFNYVVQVLTVRGLQDTQCGFKCFRGEVAQEIFSRQRMEGFGFDVEVLYLAQRAGYRIVEVPISWYHVPNSKIDPLRDTFRMFGEVVAIRWNELRGRYGPGDS